MRDHGQCGGERGDAGAGSGCANLSESLARQQYDKPSISANRDPTLPRRHLPLAQILNYAQYFDWQWARSVAGNLSWFGGLRLPFTLAFTVPRVPRAHGATGSETASSWPYMAMLFGTLSLGLMFYLNFKYGYTLPDSLMRQDFLAAVGGDPQQLTEVRERDYFFIVSFSVWGLWSGMGIAVLWQSLTEWYIGAGRHGHWWPRRPSSCWPACR